MARWLGGEMDRQSALDALRQSEERYRTLYDETPSMYFTVDEKGVIRSVNQYGAQYLGHLVEGLVGKPVAAIFFEEDRERVCAEMKAFFRHPEGVAQWEFRKVRSDGAVLWVRELARVLQSRDGESLALIVCEDITERKHSEEALRASEERFAKAFQASPHPVVISELDSGRVVDANDAAYRMFGYRREEVEGRTTLQMGLWHSAEERARFVERLKRVGSIRNMEVTLRSGDGEIRQCLLSSEPIELNGKQCSVTVGDDITDRKRAEAELHRSHTFLRQVIDTDPDLIFAKDRDGRFTMANKAVADWYGTTVENLIGKSDADFNANVEEVECFRQSDLEVIHSGRDRFIPEEKITDAGGRMRWLQTVKRPIFDDEGRVHMVLGAATDITERKRMEEILLQRERDLSAALQERERISQDLHDGILQSLYAVGLGLEACKPLIKNQQDHTVEKFVATLNQAIGQLNLVMAEVRNFIAGLESQVMQGGDFSTALRTMVETMSLSSSARCRVRIDDAAAQRLSTEQALHIINIVREGLSNALRHSRAKQITVSLRDLIRSDRLAVTDDGVGFNARSVQGVGHGLVNMAARAQKVRGLFAIQSKPDRGTRISLDLPKDTHYAHH
jgi:PAS domain S-box-containing protein